MSTWYYLDSKGNTTGPVPAHWILSKYHFKTGEITPTSKVWNINRGVDDWTQFLKVYNIVAEDTIVSIPKGLITKRLLLLMMNPYHVYIYKTKQYPNASLPIGGAKVNIEYKGYLANTIEQDPKNPKPLQHFILNRETVTLGAKKHPYGLEMALYKIRESEQCCIYIPWRLAYGDKGAGNLIPPKTDILFVLKMHQIEAQGTVYQHNNIRYDKWRKMRGKWNAQKQTLRTLYIEDTYESVPRTSLKLPMEKGKQPILPMEMKKKPSKPAPVLKNSVSENKSPSRPNTPIISPGSNGDKWNNAAKGFAKALPPNALPRGKVKMKHGRRLHKPVPIAPKHQVSQSDSALAEDLAAQFAAQQRIRNMTSYTPTVEDKGTLMPTLMYRYSNESNSIEDTKEEIKKMETEAVSEVEPLSVGRAVSLDTYSSRYSRDRGDSNVDWKHWLNTQKIPDVMIHKLIEGGLVSWDELNAIESDIEAVAKELGLTALHKIKLKALVRKLPLRPIDSVETKSARAPEEDPAPFKLQNPHIRSADDDDDDARYLKAQIALLKTENENERLQRETTDEKDRRETRDTVYTKEIEIETLQKQLNEERQKVSDIESKCAKLQGLLQLKEVENNMDLNSKLYTHYCTSVNNLISKLLSSSSTLDKAALDAVDDMKECMKNTAVDEYEKEMILNKKEWIKEQLRVKEEMNDEDTFVFRSENIDDLMKERTFTHAEYQMNIDKLCASITVSRAVFEHKLSELMLNKYNEMFYKCFVTEMLMMFYDSKLIRSQFIQHSASIPFSNDKSDILCENGDKMVYEIPLTKKLLSIIRNKESELNKVYDVLCIDHFTRNLVQFESHIVSNNVITFASYICVYLMKSKRIKNVIESGETNAIKRSAIQFVDNLMCLLVTGYAQLIVNIIIDSGDDVSDIENKHQCFANLCLSHPITAHAHSNGIIIAPESLQTAVNKENLEKMLKNIENQQLKEIINDYFANFGTLDFVDKIINVSRTH